LELQHRLPLLELRGKQLDFQPLKLLDLLQV